MAPLGIRSYPGQRFFNLSWPGMIYNPQADRKRGSVAGRPRVVDCQFDCWVCLGTTRCCKAVESPTKTHRHQPYIRNASLKYSTRHLQLSKCPMEKAASRAGSPFMTLISLLNYSAFQHDRLEAGRHRGAVSSLPLPRSQPWAVRNTLAKDSSLNVILFLTL